VQEQLVAQVPGKIEEGRWYDVKIELKGPQVNCYLDEKLVQSAEIAVPQKGGVFASAVRDNQANEVVVKLVNATSQSRDVAMELAGVKAVKPGAKGILLTAEKLSDMNDFTEPNRVAPRPLPVQISAPKFAQTVPPNSFVVLRVPAE
jgi:alpha-L-arabinofuranosidase